MEIKQLYKLYQEHPCITTDSRDCPEGSIFIALKGDTFNGNHFALQALEKGCAYAIVDEDISAEARSAMPLGSSKNSKLYTLNSKLIKVHDCLQTFKDLAREHRRHFDIPVIAITGTNGKTTTKELIRAVLSEKYNVLATEGNYNNDVGVPKTLLRLMPEHEIAVIEMGASHPGDIKTLAETAEPTCGLITNVGRAHLQGFGSFEGVVKTKGELYDYLRSRQDGLVFINADQEELVDLIADDEKQQQDDGTSGTDLWVSPYSTDPEKQYECISGEVIECSPLLKLRWRKPLMVLEEEGASTKWHKVQTQLVGNYNIYNVLAAVAVGINFGVDRKQICHAIENYAPSNSRSQLVKTDRNTLVVDAYNANPSSMMAALENFSIAFSDSSNLKSPLQHRWLATRGTQEISNLKSPKMLILGDMRELGDTSEEEHQKIVDFIALHSFDRVLLVGEKFGKTVCPYEKFRDVNDVAAYLQKTRPEGYTILIKGSNSTKLYQLPQYL